jgi:hypothetical protein
VQKPLSYFRSNSLFVYFKLDGLPGFARDFNCQLCLYLSLSLSLPSISPKPN